MVEIGDERGDGALEVDVVLPQSVVCVNEQCLVGGLAHALVESGHIVIIGGVGLLRNWCVFLRQWL